MTDSESITTDLKWDPACMKPSILRQQEEEECNKYLNGIQMGNAGESVFSSVISSTVTNSLYISAGTRNLSVFLSTLIFSVCHNAF